MHPTIWRRREGKTCKQTAVSAKNLSNVNKKLWRSIGGRNGLGKDDDLGMSLQGSDIRMDSWKLNGSWLKQESAEGSRQLHWETEICSEPQAWNNKGRPRGQVCLWETARSVRPHCSLPSKSCRGLLESTQPHPIPRGQLQQVHWMRGASFTDLVTLPPQPDQWLVWWWGGPAADQSQDIISPLSDWLGAWYTITHSGSE